MDQVIPQDAFPGACSHLSNLSLAQLQATGIYVWEAGAEFFEGMICQVGGSGSKSQE